MSPNISSQRHALVGPLHIWRMERAFQIRFLKRFGLRPHHYLLDLGCGTLRGGVPLIQYLLPGHYYGLDVREEVLREALCELRETGLVYHLPTLIWSQSLQQISTLGRTFDFIWGFDLLYILDEQSLEESFAFIRRHLAPHGVFYGNVMIGPYQKGMWKYGFPEIRREVEHYYQVARAWDMELVDLGAIAELGLATGQPKHDRKHMLCIRLKDD